MTQLVIDVVDISGGTHPDDKVRLWAPQHRPDGERVVSTSPVDVKLVDGKATVEVLPGPARVQIMTKGVVDSAPKKVTIPDEASVTLRAVIEDGLEWEPEVISRVATLTSRAESAATRAETVADTFGSLEGVAVSVQAAEDAATSATGSAAAAASSATAANDSQVSAAGSATAAAQSAVNAANSEWVAGEHKGAAEAASAAAALSADDAAASAGAAASSEAAAATSAGQADASASTASDAADRAENVAASVHWQDDRLSVMGQLSPPLTGDDGATPYVGTNGNWWVGDTDTGVRAQGEKGDPGEGSGDVLWSELNPVLDGKAPVSHDHTIGQVTGLQTALDGKAAASHEHSWGDVTGKPSAYPPESHTHPSTDISDATTVGRAVVTASSQAAARSAIGAGTSNLALGTTSSTAAAGNHTHSQYATTTTVSSVSSRVTTLENAQPIIVSSLPASPLPGRIYMVTG